MAVQFVFVHGVATRETDDYKRAVERRDQYFRSLVFGKDADIRNPYWGKYGANPPGGVYKSLPDYDHPTGDGVEVLKVASRPATGEAPKLVTLAREDFPETVDLIFTEALEDPASSPSEDLLASAKITMQYALHDPNPSWVQSDISDEQFLATLSSRSEAFARQKAGMQEETTEIETLGLRNWLKSGATSLVNRIRNRGGRLVLANSRQSLHAHVARFIGDVFSYLRDGAGRAQIRQVLQAEIAEAVSSGDEIVLMGHSMGGVILVDCLGDAQFRKDAGLTGERTVKALVTVGAQPGLFQELGLLSSPGGNGLPCVAHWLNIYDELDVLSFRAAPLFGPDVRDMLFSSRTGLLDAHTAYFTRIQFYERLRSRLKAIDIAVVPS